MNCREFITEFEERREQLSQPARLHLDDCPGCKKTSVEQTRVWQMIDGLARVDAPNDFEFHVKAKIANAKPADFQSRFLPQLRYVLPLGLIVMVFGLLTINTSFFTGNSSGGESQVSKTIVQPTPAVVISPINSFSSNQIDVAATSDEMSPANIANADAAPTESGQEGRPVTANLRPKTRTTASKRAVEDKFTGFRENTYKETTAKFPLGLDPNRRVETSPRGENTNLLADSLQVFGVETVSEGGKLKVKAVKQNSLAERSDVKVGDVIEAVNDVKPSAAPLRTKRIEVKKMTVVRGAETVEITLKN